MRKELGHGTHLRLVVKMDRSAHWTPPGQTRTGDWRPWGMTVEGVSCKHRLEVGAAAVGMVGRWAGWRGAGAQSLEVSSLRG